VIGVTLCEKQEGSEIRKKNVLPQKIHYSLFS